MPSSIPLIEQIRQAVVLLAVAGFPFLVFTAAFALRFDGALWWQHLGAM